jgi:DNA-binding ferritin-like protein (Dps family)
MLFEWRLKKIRFKQQKKLNKTNLYLYKSITSYIQNSNLRGIEKEEILQQVMDMMLQAQIENKSMNLIIGNDYEELCKEIIEEYSRGKSKTYRLLHYIQKYLLYMLFMSMFMMIFRGILNSSLELGLTVDQLILVNVISLILLPATKKSRQETSSLISLYQRLYMMRLTKSGVYALAFMLVIIGLLRFVLGKVFGPEVFNYTVTLLAGVPYVIFVLLLIVIIEIQKKVYDKR